MPLSVSLLMLSIPMFTCSNPLRSAKSMYSSSLHKKEVHSADHRTFNGIIASISAMAWLRLPPKSLSPKNTYFEPVALISSTTSSTGRFRNPPPRYSLSEQNSHCIGHPRDDISEKVLNIPYLLKSSLCQCGIGSPAMLVICGAR